jgi:chemotaxis protein MotB
LVSIGCVPKGRHEITEVQLDATRIALSARTEQAAVDAQAYEDRIAALQAEIGARQLQLDELLARAVLRDADVARLEQDRVRLVAEIEGLTTTLRRVQEELAKRTKKPPDVVPPVETLGGRSLAELTAAVDAHQREEVERARLADAREAAIAAFGGLAGEGRAELSERGDALVVRFPTGLLFQEGFTTLSPRGQQVIAAAAEALKQVPGRVVTVEGHTDDAPVHSAEWPSNWERGFSRAVAVLRALEAAGAPAKLSAASFAATRPTGDPARDDRVELVIAVDPELVEAFAPTQPQEAAPE